MSIAESLRDWGNLFDWQKHAENLFFFFEYGYRIPFEIVY